VIRRLLAALARLGPASASAGPELRRALGFLRADVAADRVVRAGYGAGLLVGATVGLAAAFLLPPVTVPPVAAAGGLVAVHAVHGAPQLVATLRRSRALGAAPGLLARIVLRMRVDPTVERAASFAARTGEGPLAASLAAHVRRSHGTPRSGLDAFAAEWHAWFPALERATGLVAAAAAAPPDERDRTLDRALSTVLDGTRDRMASFAADVVGPVTALYAFGVLLPVALVGLLPAARVAGVRVTLPAFVAVYDCLLPVVLLAACVRLLGDRPVAFPPPQVGRDHPEVPDRRVVAPAAGLLAGGVGWVLAARLVGPWAGPVAGAGLAAGVCLVALYRPAKAIRDRAREVEDGLDDALYLVGQRVAAGEAVERALSAAGEEVSGAAGETFAEAAAVGRRLGAGVRESFLGDHGALATLPSARARSAAALIALAATEGRPAGDALVALADHLDDLRALERDARTELARVTGTLSNTGALFGPLVAGATVALGDGIGRSAGATGGGSIGPGAGAGAAAGPGLEAAPQIPTAALGPAVGAYVLLLAVCLTALATGLSHGLDRALVGYRVGLALPTATLAYLSSFVAAGLLL
jgi:Flp pilus assembly protein TadB